MIEEWVLIADLSEEATRERRSMTATSPICHRHDAMDYLKEFLSDRLDRSMECFSGAGGARRNHSGA